MANKFTRFLQDIAFGALSPKGNLADFQHAARLYVDDTFRLAPKTKFLYYVVFNLNPNAVAGTAFQEQNRLEVNYLVKRADLPKYTLNNEELNQYNRKTRSYTKITYEPVNLTFHDDNAGVTNSLWALYYGYYFRDRLNSADPYTDVNPVAYQNNAVLGKESQPFRYGLDNNVGDPFFRSIQLITMSRHRFYSYLLCNPKVLSWNHDSVDQSEGNGVLQNEMSVGYDAVIYNAGTVEVGNPAGFAQLHYDPIPSPVSGNAFGIEDVFGNIFSSNGFRGLSYLEKTRDSNLFYNNTGNRAPFGYGTPSFINAPQNYYYTKNSTSGFQNYNFGATNSISNSFNNNAQGSIAGKYKGFDQTINNPNTTIDREFKTSRSDKIVAKQREFSGVIGNTASDVYGPFPPSSNDPTLDSFKRESIRTSSNDISGSVENFRDDSYNFSAYSPADRKVTNISTELVKNKPGKSKTSGSPFG
jgi:hypothetical protein